MEALPFLRSASRDDCRRPGRVRSSARPKLSISNWVLGMRITTSTNQLVPLAGKTTGGSQGLKENNVQLENRNRLLIVTPFGGTASGIKTWSRTVKGELDSDPTVDCTIVDTAVLWRASTNLRWWSRIGGGSLQALRDTLRVIRLLRSGRMDCIHLNTSASFASVKDSLILLASKLSGVRCVIQFHVGFLPQIADQNTLAWRLVRLNASSADTPLVLGDSTVSALASSAPEIEWRTVPNPIEVECFEPTVLPPCTDGIRLLFLGHILESKGVVELVKAATALRRRYPTLRLDMVGHAEQELRTRLQGLAGGEAANWLTMTGEVSYSESMLRLQQSHVLILPSSGTEGFPYVVLEAMRAGRPVVATDRGAIREMLAWGSDQPCGIVVPPGDVEALRKAVDALISAPSQMSVLGSRGRRRVEEVYSPKRVVRELKDIWFPRKFRHSK